MPFLKINYCRVLYATCTFKQNICTLPEAKNNFLQNVVYIHKNNNFFSRREEKRRNAARFIGQFAAAAADAVKYAESENQEGSYKVKERLSTHFVIETLQGY